jgi:phosphoribosylamine--glycine ligase
VLLIGSGGREHALAWKLRQSRRLGTLWTNAPEHGALGALAQPCPVAMDLTNVFRMRRWCEQERVDLVVVGPEAPLAAGIADALQSPACQVFGPTRAAARMEWDKAFAKKVMRQASVPTAEAREFHDPADARQYVRTHEEGCVVKAVGLAAGKGAVVCPSVEEAVEAIDRMMVLREFGAAGERILIEEILTGQEVSVLALVDGRTLWVFDPCQDHKRVGEGDTGANTGGMGAYCPTPLLDSETQSVVESNILVPIIDALRREGIEYRGVLYAGIMLTAGGPKVLEFNCRLGDPECQPLMMRLRSDLIELCWATCTGTLDRIEQIDFDPRTACCVVVCAEGYPGPCQRGRPITGIEAAEAMGDVVVFHGGTRRDAAGKLVTDGGRVLGVTALCEDLQAARDLANSAAGAIQFEGAFFRRDIGDRVLVS